MGFTRPKYTGRIEEQVQDVALPLLEAEDFELVHIECVTSNREKIIRLYIDKPSGVTLNDCVAVSRQLGDLIDVQVEGLGSYRLEISSPGSRRPLNKREDFIRFEGERVKIETHEPVEGRKRFTGILGKTNDDTVVIMVDGKSIEIAGSMICKASLAGQE